MSESSFIKQAVEQGIVLLDGGMGSQLIERGLKPGDCADAWNIEHPEKVVEIHKNYFNAGSDAVQTNTFGASPLRLDKYGFKDKTRDINLAGVEAARKACPQGKFVVGDIGPSGEFVEPLGDVTADELYEYFLVQAKALVEGGVDCIHVETMSCINEAVSALKAALDAGAVVMSSMTYDYSERGYFTSMGIPPVEAVNKLTQAGASAIGANCSIGPEEMTGLISELVKHTDLPVIAQANAGQPVLKDGDAVYEILPSEFAAYAPGFKEAGASVIGGCCGTTPDFIREIRKILKDG